MVRGRDFIASPFSLVDKTVTEKQFKFAAQNNLPLYYVSAADGTNVVRIFKEAIQMGIKHKENPTDNFMNDVMDMLKDVNLPFLG